MASSWSAPAPSTSAVASSSSGLAITLHPLPILSIAEHHARVQLIKREAHRKVFGGLLGVQKGREVEIVTSYELAYKKPQEGEMEVEEQPSSTTAARGGGATDVDWAFFEERTASFKQVFPTLEFVGWYTTGSADPGSAELALHRAMLGKNDASLLLLFDPSARPSSDEERDLPLKIFSTLHDVSSTEGSQVRLGQVSGWKIESGEAERVAVSSVSRDQFGGSTGSGESSLVPTLTTLRNAVQMLSSRTQILLQYVQGVVDGTMKRDEQVLRMIAGLMAGLPIEDSPEFRNEFATEYADVQLTSYLSTLSKSLLSLNNLTDKFTFLHAASSADDPLAGGSSLTGGGGPSFASLESGFLRSKGGGAGGMGSFRSGGGGWR